MYSLSAASDQLSVGKVNDLNFLIAVVLLILILNMRK